MQQHLREIAANQRQPQQQKSTGVVGSGKGGGGCHLTGLTLPDAPRQATPRQRRPQWRPGQHPKTNNNAARRAFAVLADQNRLQPGCGLAKLPSNKEIPMLTLYGVYRSRASRPLWLLAEIGQKFCHIPVVQAYRLADPFAADAPLNTLSPAFLAVSPQSAIPVMEDQGLVLTESLAICTYIARRYGGDLGPQNPSEQAFCDQWALFAATAIDPPGLDILYTYDSGQ